MSSKLKVTLSKVSHLPLLQEFALKYSSLDPRTIARKFYLKTLPKMMTMPKIVDSAPRVNLWLWLIGYLKLQWPKVEQNWTEPRRMLLKCDLIFKELKKFSPKNLTKIKNTDFLTTTFEKPRPLIERKNEETKENRRKLHQRLSFK